MTSPEQMDGRSPIDIAHDVLNDCNCGDLPQSDNLLDRIAVAVEIARFNGEATAYSKGIEDAATVAADHLSRLPDYGTEKDDADQGWTNAAHSIVNEILALKPNEGKG